MLGKKNWSDLDFNPEKEIIDICDDEEDDQGLKQNCQEPDIQKKTICQEEVEPENNEMESQQQTESILERIQKKTTTEEKLPDNNSNDLVEGIPLDSNLATYQYPTIPPKEKHELLTP